MRKLFAVSALMIGLVLVTATAFAGEATFQGFRTVNVVINGQSQKPRQEALGFSPGRNGGLLLLSLQFGRSFGSPLEVLNE